MRSVSALEGNDPTNQSSGHFSAAGDFVVRQDEIQIMMCQDKVANVTGAAGNGMERRIARTLDREGAKMIVKLKICIL